MRIWIVGSLVGHLAVILLATVLSSLISTSTPALEVMRVDLTQLDLPAPQPIKSPPAVPPQESKREPAPLPPEELQQPEPEIAEQLVPPKPELPPAPKTTPKAQPESKPQAREVEASAAAGAAASQPAEAPDPETAPESISTGTSLRMRAPEGVADYYFSLLCRKISRRWETTLSSGRGRREVETVIQFRVGAMGEIQDAEIAKSSGLSVFDRQCLSAVISANPLPVPPAQYVRGGSLPIALTFTFNP